MNQNTLPAISYKVLVTTILFLIVINVSTAQTRPPQDIRRVTVTLQYVVENGNYKSDSHAIKQEIFDSLGRCHTEIEYRFANQKPHNFKWHTFDGMQKVKTEIFENDKMKATEEYSYNSDSLLARTVFKKTNDQDTFLFLVLKYKYDSQRNIIESEAETPQGKTAFISKSTYNDKGKELTRKVKTKKYYYPIDSVIGLVSVPEYDTLSRLIGEKVTINKADKSIITKIIKYSYDNKNQLIGIADFDINGRQITRQERGYQNSTGRIALIKYFDSNDVLVKMIGKRYEIYRTNNRRIREIEY